MKPIKVIDLFKTSLGDIAILEFPDKTYPSVKMILKNSDAMAWEIHQVGRNAKFLKSDLYKNVAKPERVWDCNIKPIGHHTLIKIGDELYMEG